MEKMFNKINENNNNIKLFRNDYNNNYLSDNAFINLLVKENIIEHYQLEKYINEEPISQVQKITVIIPTHNRVQQLTQCIDSILNQNYKNVEIIIIDDCSTDDTNKIYSNYNDKRVKYILNEKNLGMGLNRQKAYNVATGDFIMFIDDDDFLIDNNYFSYVINRFEDKEIDIICSNTYIHYENDNIYKPFILNIYNKVDCLTYLNNFQIKYLKPTSSFPAIFRKSLLDNADFHNMKMMNDSSIYLRALSFGNKVYFNKNIIGIYRMHSSNDTFNVKSDFTIENLEEKKSIYNIIKNKIQNPKIWLFKEIKITVCHFLNGKENRKTDIDKVLLWTKKNVGYLAYLYYKAYRPLRNIKSKMLR